MTTENEASYSTVSASFAWDEVPRTADELLRELDEARRAVTEACGLPARLVAESPAHERSVMLAVGLPWLPRSYTPFKPSV